MARVLGAVRLSHDTDVSTSIERQREQVEHTTKARGDTLAHIAEDVDVSGAVSPFDRDGLGPWLTDPALIAQWDVLIIPKIDRLTRSLRDFDDLRVWLDANGKTLVSVSESIDLSTSMGRMFANLLAMFAQFERERIGERRAESAAKAKRDGRYDGGPVPFGYDVKDGRFVKHRVTADVAAEIAADRIDGRSWSWIARKLNADERVNGNRWRADMVKRVLTAPSLNGIITVTDKEAVPDGKGRVKVTYSEPRILRGDDGKPLKFTDEPILDDDTWSRLQATVTTGRPRRVASDFMLSAIAFCSCGAPVYGNKRPAPANPYYRCSSAATDRAKWCGARTIPVAMLESAVESAMLRRWGSRELYRRKSRPVVDHRRSLAGAERRLAEIESEMVKGNIPAASGGRMLSVIQAEIDALRAMPVEDEAEEWEPSGVTVAARWGALATDDDRSHFLKSIGIRVIAERRPKGDGGDLAVVTYTGTPEGFEQATGLLLPHSPEDHEPWYEIAGAFFRRDSDGTMVMVREPGKAESLGMIKDWFDLKES